MVKVNFNVSSNLRGNKRDMGSVDDGQGGTMPELTINAGAEEGKKPTVDSASKRENPKCNGTEVEEDGDEDEEQLSRPIVVPSQEQMRNYKLSPRPGELVNDTDYLGSDTPYFEKGDIPKQPSHIHEVTSTLEEAGISNCIVGVWALNFYGTKRVGDVSSFISSWNFCPTMFLTSFTGYSYYRSNRSSL